MSLAPFTFISNPAFEDILPLIVNDQNKLPQEKEVLLQIRDSGLWFQGHIWIIWKRSQVVFIKRNWQTKEGGTQITTYPLSQIAQISGVSCQKEKMLKILSAALPPPLSGLVAEYHHYDFTSVQRPILQVPSNKSNIVARINAISLVLSGCCRCGCIK